MKKGLVLEGGGAKGAFHCGAVKALYENGYNFDGVAGTSIGAINAALIVQDCGPESLYEMWTNVSASLFTDFDDEEVDKLLQKDFSRASVRYWAQQIGKIIKNLGIPTDKAIHFLKEYISEEKVRNSVMDYAIVTYSLSDRMPVELFKEDIPQGNLHEYILASAYYPAFKLNRINGKFYVDGGIYDNMPMTLLAGKGYEEIVAVRTMSKMPYRTPIDERVKVNYIRPSEDLGRMAALSPTLVKKKIKLGYYDALRFINSYYGKKYYFTSKPQEFAEKLRVKLHDNLQEVAEFFDLPPSASYETVYGELKNYLFRAYAGEAFSFEESTVFFLEEFAKYYGVEKFRIYSLEEFSEELLRKCYDFQNKKRSKLKFLSSERERKEKLFKILIKEGFTK